MNILITGTSRGIGLELTQIALNEGHSVWAVARKPKQAKELMALKKLFPKKLTLIVLDLTKSNVSASLTKATKSAKVFDLLINNAGIYKKGTTSKDFLESFMTNSVVPFLTTQALLSKLKKSSQPKVVQITSLMGSISDNESGGSYAYRSSKTALNMINRSLSIDHPWLSTIVMHPGWVKTRMGGSEAPTSVHESASGIWKVAQKITLADSGKFYDFEGDSIHW